MTRTQARAALRLLDKLIAYVRKNGGNRDTYFLDALRTAKEHFVKVYGKDV